MTKVIDPVETDNAIVAEQIKAFFKETSAQNLGGAVVLSLIVWVAAEFAPVWSWAPTLGLAYLAVFARAYLIRQYHRTPQARTPAAWGRGQTIGSSINGTAWGLTNMAICAYLPLPYQLFVATVAAVSAAAAASEGFAYFQPSRAFILTSLTPLTFWFFSQPSRLHLTLGIMLCLFILILLWQGSKRHHAFIASLKLRFQNEFLARELAVQRKIAEDAGQAKSRFLAAASHDLRQPVQAIAIFQELMRPEMTLTPEGEVFFTKTKEAVKALSSLLGSLLDISRLESNTVKVRSELICLSQELDQLQREFGGLAEQKGIRLRAKPCSACINTDPILLGQILRNLIANALRYTPSGRIIIGCRRHQDMLSIEVWDSGIGIREEDQAAIFDEFFQVGNKERDRLRGLGLGLAIVNRAAKLIDAKITVRSRIGKGSCFAVSLPISKEATARTLAPPPQAECKSPFDLENRTIILIENEEMIRVGLHTLLENWGCTVISGRSLKSIEALIADPIRVDAIISDFGLSEEENGVQAIQHLRARFGQHLPALLMTGDTSQGALEAASLAGLTLLHKPARPWLLRQTLCSLIQSPSATKNQ